MTVFRRTAANLDSPLEKQLSEVLAEHMRMAAGINVSASERRAWDRSLPVVANDLIEAGLGQVGDRPKLHPVLQAKGYCDYIGDFTAVLADHPDAVRGGAYLHNAAKADVSDLYDRAADERTRLFTQTTRGGFVDYLKDRFAPEPGAGAADRLLASEARPSKQLSYGCEPWTETGTWSG